MVVKHISKEKDQRTQIRPRYHTIVDTLPPIRAQDNHAEHNIKKNLHPHAQAHHLRLHLHRTLHYVPSTPITISNQCAVRNSTHIPPPHRHHHQQGIIFALYMKVIELLFTGQSNESTCCGTCCDTCGGWGSGGGAARAAAVGGR